MADRKTIQEIGRMLVRNPDAGLDALSELVQNERKKPNLEQYADILPSTDADGRITYGSAGRTRPAWERAYERQPWTEEERKWRTPEHDRETQEFIRATVTNDQALLREIADRPHNRAFHAEWARADLASGTIASPGTGFGAVPIGFASQLQTILVRASRMRQHVTIINGNEHAQKVPVQGAKTVAAKHAEASDMTSGVTEPTYTSVTPEAVKLGAVVKMSRELLDDSPLSLVSAVTQDIGEAIGTLEDSSILDGTTFSDSLFDSLTPHGSITWTDATETLATLAAKYYALGSVFRSRATWVVNEAAAEVFATETGTGERQLFTEFSTPPNAIDDVGGQTGVLMGRPVVVFPAGTGGVPANEGIFGDLSGYVLYVRENFRAASSTDSDFGTDQVAIKVARRVDGVVSQAGRMNLYG